MGAGVTYAPPGTKFFTPPGFIRYLELEVQLKRFAFLFFFLHQRHALSILPSMLEQTLKSQGTMHEVFQGRVEAKAKKE